jgi:hypothetical protein
MGGGDCNAAASFCPYAWSDAPVNDVNDFEAAAPLPPFGIPEGAKVLFSRPPRPLPGYLIRCIASLIASVPGVTEAHLPQCFVADVMTEPAQLLVLVLAVEANEREVVTAVEAGLEAFLRAEQHLEIWAMPTTSRMLETVRKAGCGIQRSTF